ncbi:hypothetical protein [Anabaena sp. CCY 0017]
MGLQDPDDLLGVADFKYEFISRKGAKAQRRKGIKKIRHQVPAIFS